ncbi:N-succinylglutamate 5-semialdehyde dehydrogenase [Raoultella terrigena]|uniref:N-succinylglutamate 5-semialdehyde dehydrogenase n=1 Tax=Raoultella terrigena TaxID=577 RepID=A0A4U9CUH2_RAOTE|nr:N-succinylglutamate 5-semialdehyde dehydrogenase [Raoultella terrigena]
MSLWINGDWQTGRGPARSKSNPVSAEPLWQGNDADAGQVAQAVEAARRAFRRGPKRRFACARRSSKSLPPCWRPTKRR